MTPKDPTVHVAMTWEQARAQLTELAEQIHTLEAKLAEARGEGFSEGAKGAFAWQEKAKRAEARLAEAQREIERLKAEKDQMYQLGRSIEIERDNLKAEIERLKAELRIWQECSARQDHELDDLARKLEQAEAKLERMIAAIEFYRGTYLVSKSGTHLGDPAAKILAAAAAEVG